MLRLLPCRWTSWDMFDVLTDTQRVATMQHRKGHPATIEQLPLQLPVGSDRACIVVLQLHAALLGHTNVPGMQLQVSFMF